jgi:hypothetical protein
VGDHGWEGTSSASLERSRRSRGWKAPRVRPTVTAFASLDRRRPYKARDVSALRARRASSPVTAPWVVTFKVLGEAKLGACGRRASVWSPVVAHSTRRPVLVSDRGCLRQDRLGKSRSGVTDVAAVVASFASRGARTLGCTNSAGDVLQERHHPPCGSSLPQQKRRGFGGSGSCLGVHTIAEVDGRHVAQSLR